MSTIKKKNLEKKDTYRKEDDYDITISMPYFLGFLLFIGVHIHIFYIAPLSSLTRVSYMNLLC